MAATKKESAEKARPLRVIRFEDVSASIFANVHEVNDEDVTFYNVVFQRAYKSGEETRWTNSFGWDDLSKLIAVIKEADAYISRIKRAEA